MKVKIIPITEIQELNEEFWYGSKTRPTCLSIAKHAKLINESNLEYPIILCHRGRVMDGMHRVCKAIIDGHKSIKTVQFDSEIKPDYVGISPNDLPY